MTTLNTLTFPYRFGGTLETLELTLPTTESERLSSLSDSARAEPPELLLRDDDPLDQIRLAMASDERVFRDAMREWTASSGSASLRLASRMGLETTGSYVRERAAREIPGWIVALRRQVPDAEVLPRDNPSPLAMETFVDAVERGLNPAVLRLVWMKSRPETFTGEALRIEGYLGRYGACLYIEEIRASFLSGLRLLGRLLEGGVPVVSGLRTVSEVSSQGFLADRFQSAAETIDEGADIGVAVGAVFPTLLPSPLVSILRAGEMSGSLSSSIPLLIDELEREYALSGLRLRSGS